MHHGDEQDNVWFSTKLNCKDAKAYKICGPAPEHVKFWLGLACKLLVHQLGQDFHGFGVQWIFASLDQKSLVLLYAVMVSDIFVGDLCSLQSFTFSPRCCCHILSLLHRSLKPKSVRWGVCARYLLPCEARQRGPIFGGHGEALVGCSLEFFLGVCWVLCVCVLWAAPPWKFPTVAVQLKPGLELLVCFELARSVALKLIRVLQSLCDLNRSHSLVRFCFWVRGFWKIG